MGHGTVHVFCDESGNGDATKSLVVAAIAISDSDLPGEVDALQEQYDRVLELARASGVDPYEKFQEQGFHRHKDKYGAQAAFVERLGSTLTRKVFLFATDRATVSSTDEVDHLIELYRRLSATLVRKFRDYAAISFVIENNDDLRRRWADLVAAVQPAAKGPRVSAEMVPKSPTSPLAEADYFAATCLYWLDSGMQPPASGSKSGSEVTYLQFVELLPNVSLVLSLERGRLHSRRHPWGPVVP